MIYPKTHSLHNERLTVLSTDMKLLHDKRAKKHPAYAAFVLRMKGRSYGSEAVNDAWAWFKSGHEDGAKSDRSRTRKSQEPTIESLRRFASLLGIWGRDEAKDGLQEAADVLDASTRPQEI